MRVLPGRRSRVRLTSLVWNAKANAFTAANGARVTHWLDRWVTGEVRRITLTEVKGVHDELLGWANRNGWLLLQEDGTPDPAGERGDTAMLLRVEGKHALAVTSHRIAEMHQPWMVFDHQQRKAPRRHQRAVLDVDGVRLPCGADHWPTSGNRAAWMESLNAAKQFLRRGGILDGDLNATYDEVSQLADDLAGDVRGRKPDWALTTRGRIVSIKHLGDGGSDHDAFIWTVEL